MSWGRTEEEEQECKRKMEETTGKPHEDCWRCNGTGMAAEREPCGCCDDWVVCNTCDGTGFVPVDD